MPTVYNLILLTPLWIILPGIVTLLVAVLILRGTADPSGEEIKHDHLVIELENEKK